mmetsp:Transcript_10312/g.36344  ORF Transcript_10312/g.36344 Transcript_10312/m.36344 type:complete len:179 (-) Transcript_10312:41-577(-)
MTSLSPLSPAPKTCSGPSPRSSSANSQRANRAGSTLRRLARPRLRVDRRRRRIRLKWPSRRAVRRSPRPSSPRTLTGPGGDAATPRIRPRVVLAIHAMPREDAQAAQQTISLLDAVARAPRFSLSVMFLEQQHKDAVTAILAAANALAPAEQPNADADTPPLEASKDALSKIAALYGL